MTASLSQIFMIEMISLCECMLDLEERVNIYAHQNQCLLSPGPTCTHHPTSYELDCPLNDSHWVHVPIYHREEM